MTVRILRAADRAPVPWKNGGGTVREIATGPEGAGTDAFDWRVSLADVTADGFDAGSVDGLVIPGGHAPDKMRRDPAILDLVRAVHAAGKPIGIICHGGSVAISAGIVGGRATGSLGIKDDLVLAGAEWVDEPAFRDGQLVWGRVVADIPAFERELVAAFAEAAGS